MSVAKLALIVLMLSNYDDDPCMKAMMENTQTAARVRRNKQPKPYEALKSAFVKLSPGCDDGGPGEALSDLVVGTIAFNWKTVAELFQKMDADSGFHAFVIKHVDGTCDTHELRTILNASTKSCPKNYSRYCDELGAAAKDALAMIDFYTKPR